VPLHGQQEGAHFHAHYDNYCYLPLYVFCGQDMLRLPPNFGVHSSARENPGTGAEK
jgi:hypothetical protein